MARVCQEHPEQEVKSNTAGHQVKRCSRGWMFFATIADAAAEV
jgi:hypothetical protein